VIATWLRTIDRAIPRDPEIDAFLRKARPDVLAVTPLIEPGSPQAEYLRSARGLGIRTAFCVASWDNLTNKGLIHGPVDLVAVCHRVCIDELRHTELAVKMVEIYGGEVPDLPREISVLPSDEKLTVVAQACRSAILLSCLGETFACTELAMLRNRCDDPVAHGVLTVFLADEIVHARVGWAYLAHAFKTTDDATRRSVAEAIPEYVAGIARNLFGADDVAAAVDVTNDDPRLAAHGVCSMREEQDLYRTFVPDVFIPGLRAIGVPVDVDAVVNAVPKPLT